jgi:hypothetical protein
MILHMTDVVLTERAHPESINDGKDFVLKLSELFQFIRHFEVWPNCFLIWSTKQVLQQMVNKSEWSSSLKLGVCRSLLQIFLYMKKLYHKS